MDRTTFARLVGELRGNAELFQTFLSDPAAALATLPYLDDATRRAMGAVDPRAFIADASALMERDRVLQACGPRYTCSCTSYTCGGVTCGGSTCDVTCTEFSCGNTCGDSCGFTTNFESRFFVWK
ncbi:hypothetical protein F2P45_02910 [Massilia sp. CCM 8733]|uniref:Uncharacterized protein n=1 Tax=Massilia mucilaginosa TaxID=2609282 RepID=A0ABX0NMH3_9BURK|nr:hypothetical protein [Massilia mucilaginosa]NHZ87986.1 hypothetical protein [Massilia mucilaginosa]